MYELVFGSIFDKKCDIIVIPCDSMGGVTGKIKGELAENDILNTPSVRQPGTIIFDNSRGGFTNAQVIGFAAAVDGHAGGSKGSRKEYLQNICRELILYCKFNSLSLINMPLLGAGAGGLSVEESFGILKENFENEKEVDVKIFALSKEIYFHLDRDKRSSQIKNPRVFISYTGENPENRKWVKNFACRLRENGVNARVDIFHLKPGDDLPQWMTNELLMADKVLLICDKYYVRKADSRNGGVGWETMIIQGDMMNHSLSSKYICIAREKNMDDSIPMYAKTKYSLQWAKPEISEEDFHELLYDIFDVDTEPELGDIPEDIKKMLTRK